MTNASIYHMDGSSRTINGQIIFTEIFKININCLDTSSIKCLVTSSIKHLTRCKYQPMTNASTNRTASSSRTINGQIIFAEIPSSLGYIAFLKCIYKFPENILYKNILLLYDNFRGHKTENVTDFLENNYR
jgi:hypothetical protein